MQSRTRILSIAVIMLAVLAVAGMALAQGAKKRRPLPEEYGRVVMDNYSEESRLAPVSFNHWFHRAKFTCRLCHVDIGFAMKANATGVRAADNINGYFCGTCHNGRMAVDGKTVFKSCAKKVSAEERPRCARCHTLTGEGREYEFRKFTEGWPRERFGNGIDWEKAELEKYIVPIDYIEGVSIKRPPLKVQQDFALEAKVTGIPDIIYSHRKHTVWNGCEVCHPAIFPAVKRGAVKYTMVEIFEGKYCGTCHGMVAFPLQDCQRCHAKPVQ